MNFILIGVCIMLFHCQTELIMLKLCVHRVWTSVYLFLIDIMYWLSLAGLSHSPVTGPASTYFCHSGEYYNLYDLNFS